MEHRSNKIIVAEFYKKIVKERNSSLINDYVKEDYIQHSAMGKDGREGLFEMVEFLKTLPQPEETKSPIINMIEEGDYVAAHLDLTFMGKHIVLIELFRLQDGMAAEHWDVTEEPPEQNTPTINIDGISNNAGLNNKEFIVGLYRSTGVIIHHMLAEGDHVAVHGELRTGSKSVALFDIFKIKGELITEHYYVKQEVPVKMMHSNGMF